MYTTELSQCEANPDTLTEPSKGNPLRRTEIQSDTKTFGRIKSQVLRDTYALKIISGEILRGGGHGDVSI